VTLDLYRRHYVEIQFERAGLFALVQQSYGGNQALYPGCFVHITPSLFFPHVVYIDRHPEAQSFFADLESISRFVERNKHYKRSAYLRFIAQDFTDSLPLPDGSFDLLISIFTGEVARTCNRYLKPGGLLLTNDRLKGVHDEAAFADFKLISVIRFKRGKYHLIEDRFSQPITSYKAPNRVLRYLRLGDRGVQYVENEIYYIFRKHRPRDP
jgi:hypothetical protein